MKTSAAPITGLGMCMKIPTRAGISDRAISKPPAQ